MRHYTDCAVLRSKLSEKLGIEIVDRVQENPVLRDFLTPFELLYMKLAQVKSSRQKIKELVRSGTPANSSINGWALLHTACSLGDKDLVEILVLRVGPKGGTTCSRRSWKLEEAHEADTESLLNRHYFKYTKDIGAPHFNIMKVIQWLCNTLCLQLQQRQALLEALFLGVITSHYKNEQTIEESVESSY